MSIEKKDILDLPFVDGVPQVGQQRIDWIQCGEKPGGATSPVTNEGSLNRAGVKIQQNVKAVYDNTVANKEVIDQLVDVVNTHNEIINADGDGTNLYQRVGDLEVGMTNRKVEIKELQDMDKAIQTEVSGVIQNIGIVPPEQVYRTVRDELTHQKQMMGNYKGFNWDGTADVDAIGRGMKGQIERNFENIVKHETRLSSLEKWWDGKTPDELITAVNAIRYELGTAPVNPKNIYDRLNVIENEIGGSDALTEKVSRLAVATNLNHFPIDYYGSRGDKTVTQNIWDYVLAVNYDHKYTVSRTSNNEADIAKLVNLVGSKNDNFSADTAWGEINENRDRIKTLEVTLGQDPSEGLRGTVRMLDLREEAHFTRLDGVTNSLSDIVNVELKPLVTSISTEMYDPVNGVVSLVKGAPTGNSAFDRMGAAAASRLMFEDIYQIYTAGGGYIMNPVDKLELGFVRYFDVADDLWKWKKQQEIDLVLGTGMKFKAENNDVLMTYSNDTVMISDGMDIQLRGTVTAPVVLKDNVGLYSNKSQFLAAEHMGDDIIVHVGDNLHTDEVLFHVADVDGVSVDFGTATGTVLHTENFADHVEVVDPRLGVDLYEGFAVTSVDSLDDPVHLIGVVNDTVSIGDYSHDIELNGDIQVISLAEGTAITSSENDVVHDVIKSQYGEIIIGGSDDTTVVLRDNGGVVVENDDGDQYSVWHDGLDAPSDGAFYARKDGAWTGFNPNGGGSGSGIGDEAPDNGLQHVRVSSNGTGSWEVLGSKGILFTGTAGITKTIDSGTVNMVDISPVGTVSIGDTGLVTQLRGTVDHFTGNGFKFTDGHNGITYSPLEQRVTIGHSVHNIVFMATPKVFHDANTQYSVWHDGLDAPADGLHYARKDGVWEMVFNGVNPAADVEINQGSRYRINGYTIGALSTQGTSRVVNLSDTNAITRVNGLLQGVTMTAPSTDQFIGIMNRYDTLNDVKVVGLSQSVSTGYQVELGNTRIPTRISGTALTFNGKTVLTTEYDAPADGNRYVRQNNAWTPAYYYGNFATDAPVNPTEGTVFYEFIN